MERLHTSLEQAPVQTRSCLRYLTTHHIFHQELKPSIPAPPSPRSVLSVVTAKESSRTISGHPEVAVMATQVLSSNRSQVEGEESPFCQPDKPQKAQHT